MIQNLTIQIDKSQSGDLTQSVRNRLQIFLICEGALIWHFKWLDDYTLKFSVDEMAIYPCQFWTERINNHFEENLSNFVFRVSDQEYCFN